MIASILFSVVLALVGSACGTKTPPSDTATGAPTSTAVKPVVARPLDAHAYATPATVCGLLPEDQARKLGLREHRGDAFNGGLRCLRYGGAGVGVDIQLFEAKDVLGQAYDLNGAHPGAGYAFVKPVVIARQPAAVVAMTGRPLTEYCQISVGLSASSGFTVEFSGDCAKATAAAQAIVDNLAQR